MEATIKPMTTKKDEQQENKAIAPVNIKQVKNTPLNIVTKDNKTIITIANYQVGTDTFTNETEAENHIQNNHLKLIFDVIPVLMELYDNMKLSLNTKSQKNGKIN